MSAARPRTAWQSDELVHEFLHQRATVLPLLDVQEDLVRRLFERCARPVRRVLDVGCGDGAMAELVLGVAPAAEAVLVDNSEPMLAAAQRRFAGRDAAWQAVRADLRDPAWADALPQRSYDAAVSGFAIHHLEAERKRSLFAELFGLLAPGGMFVNMDVVLVAGPLSGLLDEQMVANAIAAERQRGGPRSDEQIERELLADDSDDRPDGADEQLSWLREAGFEQAEVHFKWADAAVFGAIKPEKGSE
jgi:ubiquinone/menaquinone biosynthesis C-methylase UbiE